MDERIYRPRELSAETRDDLTVGRSDLIDDAVTHISESCGRKSKHHFLFIGPRGIGKTHLIACIQDRVDRDPSLSEKTTFLLFPEESVGTLSFAGFLTQLVELLIENCPGEPEWRLAAERIKALSDPKDIVDSVSPLFRKLIAKPGHTVVVVLENLHELLSKQFRSRTDVGAMRKFFMDNNGFLLMASALGHFDAITSVDEPFFDFFDVQILPPLSKKQSIELFQKYKWALDSSDRNASIDRNATVMALHDLVGGNSRWMSVVIGLMVRQPHAPIDNLIRSLLDRATPTYFGILKNLAAQECAILDAFVEARTLVELPTPAFAAGKLDVSVQQASSLLKRLSDARHLTSHSNPADKRSRLYSLRDSVLDLWLGWNSGAERQERIALVGRYLERFYQKPQCPVSLDSELSHDAADLWPKAAIRIADLDLQPNYLTDIDRMRFNWVQHRDHELEHIVNLMEHDSGKGPGNPLTLQNYCAAKLRLLEAQAPVNIESKLRSAVLYAYREEWAQALQATDEAISFSEAESKSRLIETATANREYVLAVAATAESTDPADSPDLPDRSVEDTHQQYVESAYVSYAWGDDTTKTGMEREQIVDLLCTTLATNGIRIGRDKDDVKAGDSIEEFAKKIARADRIVAVLSKKSLESKYCMVYELFQAFRRCNYQIDEFQDKVIALVLDDAKEILSNDDQLSQLVSGWKAKAKSLRATLARDDSDRLSYREWTWLRTMEEMAGRLREMLAAINDIVMPRGFDTIRDSNFVDVLDRLVIEKSTDKPLPSSSTANFDRSPLAQKLADSVGQTIVESFKSSSLRMNGDQNLSCFKQAEQWIDTGGKIASSELRANIQLRMADCILNHHTLRSLGVAVAKKYLAKASNLLTPQSDPYLLALKLSIAALIEDRLGDSSERFDALSKCDHGIALATRISLLLKHGDIPSSIEIAESHAFTDLWAEHAAIAYIHAGRYLDAENACDWLKKPGQDLAKYYRAVFRCGLELFSRCQNRNSGKLIPGALSEDDQSELTRACNFISPIVVKVQSAGSISDFLERETVALRLRLAHWLGEVVASEMAGLLLRFRPIHRDVLNAIRWGLLEATPAIVSQVRAENEGKTSVLISAAEIEVFRLEGFEDGLAHAESLVEHADNKRYREKLADIAFQVASFGPNELFTRAKRLMTVLVGKEHRFFTMLDAKDALESEDFARAETVLRSVNASDDPDWLSLLALSLEGQGKNEEALTYLDELCDTTGHPAALWRAYRAVVKLGEKDRVEPLLRRLQKHPGEREKAMELLVELYHDRKTDESLQAVIPILETLAEMNPDEDRYSVNKAMALRSLSRVDEAISYLKHECQERPDCETLFALLAETLEQQARTSEAFQIIDDEAVKKRFWGSRNFVRRYMDVAYATGHEVAAHEAVRQLKNLEAETPKEERYLRQLSTDELMEEMRGRRKFHDDLDAKVVRGELPWSLPSHISHVPLTAAVAYRTQPLRVGESISWCSRFVTYATNAFVVAKRAGESESQFVRSTALPGDRTIVADLTALVTLERLGILNTVSEFYDQILIPASYRDYVGRDASRLQPHQRSRVEQTERLVTLIESRVLTSRGAVDSADTAIVDVDSDAADKFLPGDVLAWLADKGGISAKNLASIRKKYNLPTSSRDDFAEAIGAGIVDFASEAIRSLDSAGVLDALIDETNVILHESAVEDIRADLFASQYQAKQLRENQSFWRTIGDVDNIVFAEVADLEDEDGVVDEAFNLSLSSMRLARDRSLPLLVDDRVLLSATHNGSPETPDSAFSSFDLIDRLLDEDILDFDTALDCFRKLMRWRYRFYVLSPKLLLFALKNFRSSGKLVGKPLEEISDYVQACMRDVGLFGGNCEVDPPRSIAFELYTKWTYVAAELILEARDDDSISDTQLTDISRWVVQKLVPNVPLAAPVEQQVNMAQHGGKMLLTHLLTQLAMVHDERRSKFVIPVIRDEFDMSTIEFHRTISDIVEGYRHLDLEDEPVDPKKWREGIAVMQRSVVRHALADQVTDEGFTVDPHSAALLEASGSLRVRVQRDGPTESGIDALNNVDSEFRVDAPRGPLFFHRDAEDTIVHVFPITDLLVFQNEIARKAAIAYLQQLSDDGSVSPAKITNETIKQRKRQAIAKTAKTWYPAMLEIENAVTNDWRLNLAGFRQSLITQKNDWISPFWAKCVAPEIHPAHTVPKEAFFAVSDGEWVSEKIEALKSRPDAQVIVDEYMRLFKHLPLDSPLALYDVLSSQSRSNEQWQELIDRLLTIASENDYLAAFQACRTLMAANQHWSETQKPAVLQAVGDFVRLSQSEEIDSPRRRRWVILGQLASHFSHWIGFYGPQLSADHTTSLAWWLSDQLSAAVMENLESKDDPKTLTENLLTRNLESVIKDTSLIGQFTGPPTDGSFFHANTFSLHDGGPFLFSFLMEASKPLAVLADDLGTDLMKEISDWMTVRGIVGIANRNCADSLLYRNLEERLSQSLKHWANHLSHDENTFASVRNETASLGDEDFVENLLNEFSKLELNPQSYLFVRLRHAGFAKKLSPTQFLKFFSSQEKRDQFLDGITEHGVAELLTLLLQMRSYGDLTYCQQLPHLLVNFLDTKSVASQTEAIVHAIVCAAASGFVYSAIDRLQDMKENEAVQGQLELEAQFLSHLQGIAPSWTWSRLRPLLQKLGKRV